MDFDFNISDEVPLWKTFDYLITIKASQTQPSLVVAKDAK